MTGRQNVCSRCGDSPEHVECFDPACPTTAKAPHREIEAIAMRKWAEECDRELRAEREEASRV